MNEHNTSHEASLSHTIQHAPSLRPSAWDLHLIALPLPLLHQQLGTAQDRGLLRILLLHAA